ncbi:MAG: MFS transporter [Thermoclostridium sp.]|nr:MFS transporter [Thermoclostridium sp.]
MRRGILLRALIFSYFIAGALLFPHFSLYLGSFFVPEQIGILMAVVPVSMLLTHPFWGRMAAKWGARRVLIITLILSIISACGLLFAKTFLEFLIVLIVYSLFIVSIASMIDQLILSMDTEKYGRIRLYGSVGYAIAVFLGGVFKSRLLGFWSFLLHIIFLLLTLILVILIPAGQTKNEKRTDFSRKAAGFALKKEFIIILAASFLIGVSNKATDTFLPIGLTNLQASDTLLGTFWLIKTLPEILIFYLLDKAVKRISPRKVMLTGIVLYTVRMAIISSFPNPSVWMASQLIASMAFCFWYYGTITTINTMLDDNQKSMGNSIFWAVTYGFGEMTGSLAGGFIAGKLGLTELFWITTAICFLAAVILYSSRLTGKRTALNEPPL